MKNIKIRLLTLLLLVSWATVKSNAQKLSDKLSLEISTTQGVFKKNKWVKLYVNFINNSNKDIVILKPSTKYGYQIDFFDAYTQCQEPAITEAPERSAVTRKTEELLTIKAKSKVALAIPGNLYDIICSGGSISVKIQYDSTELPSWIFKKFDKPGGQAIRNLYKKLTKIKVESAETKIKLKW